jgi:hypothetical protein
MTVKRLATVVVIIAAGVVLAACTSTSSTSSSAGASSPAKPMSGTETITGRVTGAAAFTHTPTIPLKLTGPVTTTSTITLDASTLTMATFTTADGNLVISHTKGTTSTKLVSTSTCKYVHRISGQTYTVVGSQSTGKFKGAVGHGTAAIVVGGNLPKKAGDKCDTSAEAIADTGYYTLTAHGPLTLKT